MSARSDSPGRCGGLPSPGSFCSSSGIELRVSRCVDEEPLVASLLLVAMPGAPSSFLLLMFWKDVFDNLEARVAGGVKSNEIRQFG